MARYILAIGCVGILIGSLSSSVPVTNLRYGSTTENEDQLALEVIQADSPRDAARSYRNLFDTVGDDSIPNLQQHPYDSLAIQAAWEGVELTLPTKSDAPLRPCRTTIGRFLGFLEGRSRVNAPQWWVDAVLDVRANHRGSIEAGGINARSKGEHGAKGDSPPKVAVLDTLNGKPAVRIGSALICLPAGYVDAVKKQGLSHGFSAYFTSSQCFIAAYESAGHPYSLTCFDIATSKTRWTSLVWGSHWGATTGIFFHWVEVVVQRDKVAVFGVSTTGFYTEVFRMKDGKNLMRFSNAYSSR